jgi:hypothetical protein
VGLSESRLQQVLVGRARDFDLTGRFAKNPVTPEVEENTGARHLTATCIEKHCEPEHDDGSTLNLPVRCARIWTHLHFSRISPIPASM